jgi:transcription elongation factor GreA-like protein
MATKREAFETMLTGGHPNSLGRTIEVVELVFADPSKFAELYGCYFSKDEVVRLRTSNAVKRVCAEHPEWLEPYVDKFLSEVATIKQASAQWTLAQLFASLASRMNPSQKQKAIKILKRNLEHNHDWIVQNHTMQTLADWAKTDEALKKWLEPHLDRLVNDERKSVAGRARKLRKALYGK